LKENFDISEERNFSLLQREIQEMMIKRFLKKFFHKEISEREKVLVYQCIIQ